MDHPKGAVRYQKITVQGVVQGIGFRPAVFRLAQEWGICGTVQNTGGAVEILASGSETQISLFADNLQHMDIPFMRIERMDIQDVDCFTADVFRIIESGNDPRGEERFISPDLALCDHCIVELENEDDRRAHHYFNACVSCGPRFSVVQKLPYDRDNTTMRSFVLCPSCQREYTTVKDRRYHAEMISCKNCGPHLMYRTQNANYDQEQAFLHAAEDLKQGGIVAIKGIGGYHFACSAFDENAVNGLRSIKGRDQKPFAVMFAHMDEIKKVCEVSLFEEELLMSNPRPITLLPLKKDFFASGVLCGDIRCGCFLPYTPLHYLLMQEINMLIMTSANRSGCPIIKDDEEMLAFFHESNHGIFGVLSHDREIVRSMEDSVVQCMDDQVQMIRRSRGVVPTPIRIENQRQIPFLAMGGDLKASFCLVKGDYAYPSQYFGDIEEMQAFRNYAASIEEYEELLAIQPEFILCDKHPGYVSSMHASTMGLPVMQVQHHHAHIASVMAEHQIRGKIIGVALDGTGYGEDGHIWGGEFLLCEEAEYRRVGHLAYTKLIGGAQSAVDARKTATCFLQANNFNTAHEPDEHIRIIQAALASNSNTVQSSSMGRLFDAAASILGICHENQYEGQCAIRLQRSAELAYLAHTPPSQMAFEITQNEGQLLISSCQIIQALYEQSHVGNNASIGAMALGFHMAIAKMVEQVCCMIRDQEGVHQVALSGGVFQNALLLKHCMSRLGKEGFQVLINHTVPPGDGGIALGQAYIGTRR